MRTLYRIILLFLIFVFLSTFNPKKSDIFPSQNIFFQIKDIEIINNNLISQDVINKKVSQIYGKNILFLKKTDIEDFLKKIDFLEKIEVRKKYPHTLIIKIYETTPVAVIFKKKKRYLLDSSSNLIIIEEDDFKDNFPNVYGKNAEIYFINFFNQLKKNNFPTNKIKNFYYFQIGRCDLELQNNQLIKLPSDKTTQAIQQIVELLDRDDMKKYNTIDLRMSDKIIVE